MLSKQFEKLNNTLPVSYNPFPQLDDRSFIDNILNTLKDTCIYQKQKLN